MDCNFIGSNCKFCEIDCKEKAPVTLQSEQGANQINQLHNTTINHDLQTKQCVLCNNPVTTRSGISTHYCKGHNETVSEWMTEAYDRIQETTIKSGFEILEAMILWIEKKEIKR